MEILSGRRGGPAASLLRGGLWLASKPYGAAMRARRWAYRRKWLPSKELCFPVVCVGNLTTGGTGKTPMVAWVVDRLLAAGASPAILTRGYRARQGRSDEAELLRELTGAPVAIDPDRVAGARKAISGGADVLVMDDGFQHLRLRRDLDIVLLDATCPWGFDHCLPRGLLREPPAALAAAGAVVVTRADRVAASAVEEILSRAARLSPRASLHTARHAPEALIDETGASRPVDRLSGARVGAVCGIGNPESFFAALRELGAELAWTEALDDHAPDAESHLQAVAQRARQTGVDAVVITQKDAARWPGADLGSPTWQLAVRMRIDRGREELESKLRRIADRAKQCRSEADDVDRPGCAPANP